MDISNLPQYSITSLIFLSLTLLCTLLVGLLVARKARQKVIDDPKVRADELATMSLPETLIEFCKGGGWSGAQQIMSAHPELLSAEMDGILEILIADYSKRDTAEAKLFYKSLIQRRDLIRRAREVGVEKAFEEAIAAHRELVRTVWEFCKASKASTGRSLIEAHPELLSYKADDILEEWIDTCEKRRDLSQLSILIQRRDVLRRVREVGVDKVFEEVIDSSLPLEVQNIIDALPGLVQTKEMPRRIELCREALSLISREQEAEWWAWLQNQLAYGLLATPMGSHVENVRAAIEVLEQALQAMKGKEDSQLWAELKMNLTTCHAELGEYNSAREAYQAMLASFQDKGDAVFKAHLLSNIATSHFYSLGMEPEGLKSFSRRVAEDPEKLETAIEFYNQARQNLNPTENPVSWINVNTQLGGLYPYRPNGDRAENNRLAIEACQQALSLCSPEFQPWHCYLSASFLGSSYFEQNDWRAAYDAFALAIAAGEELYRSAYAANQKQMFARMNEVPYDAMLEICLKLRDDPKFARDALIYCEAGKARFHREQIGQSRFPLPSHIPSYVFATETEILAEIHQINRKLERPQLSLDEGQRLVESRKALRKNLEAFWSDLEQKYPSAQDYVAFRRAKAPSWSELAELAEHLGPEAAIIEFYALPDRIVAFVLRHGWEAPRIFELPISTKKLVTRYVQSYMDEIVNRSHFASFVGKPLHNWLDLGEELLAPLESVLGGARLVYFVPHDTLHIIPLHALRVNGEPFITKYAVAYAPSAAVLRRILQRASVTENKNDVLVMGYTPNQDKLERQVFLGEALTVAGYFGVKPLLDGEATSKAMRRLAPKAKLIHLSCHGSFVSADPFDSCILLADEEFTIREWMELRLQADLITLSACQTGASYYQSGDEVISISRALLCTGASSALLSLWSVDALSTARWMQLFYREMWNHTTGKWQPAAYAFQRATLKLREEKDDPYYWAPFILVGDWH